VRGQAFVDFVEIVDLTVVEQNVSVVFERLYTRSSSPIIASRACAMRRSPSTQKTDLIRAAPPEGAELLMRERSAVAVTN